TITSSTLGSCPTGDYCEPTQAQCQDDYNTVYQICMGHLTNGSVTYAPNPCGGSRTLVTPPVRDVRDLVARGFTHERTAPHAGARVFVTTSSNATAQIARTAVHAHATTHAPTAAVVAPALASWLAGSLAVTSLAATTYMIYARVHPHR